MILPDALVAKLCPSGSEFPSSRILVFIEDEIKMIFKEREKFALVNFLDISKTTIIDKDHFYRELLRGEKVCIETPESSLILDLQPKKELRPPKVPSKLEPMTTPGGKQPSPQPSSKLPPMVNEVQEANMISIVKRIEAVSPMSLFLLATLENCRISEGYMLTKDLEDFLNQSYGRHLNTKERALLIKTMDLNNNGKIELTEFRDVFLLYLVLQTVHQRPSWVP
jgi:hypothetical protein